MSVLLMINKQPIPADKFELDLGEPEQVGMNLFERTALLALKYPIESLEVDFHLLDIVIGMDGAEPNTRVEQSFVAITCGKVANKMVLRLLSNGAPRTEAI